MTRPAPRVLRPALLWLRANLFASWGDGLVTVALLALLAAALPPLIGWGLVDAVWDGSARDCRAAEAGACWAFVREKFRFILFGTYPADQIWRPALTVAVFVALYFAACDRRLWRPRFLLLWTGGLGLTGLLMWGGVFGLPYVENRLWGGLPLTLGLATVGLAAAFPLAVLLALGRRSDLPAIRWLCIAWIEAIRGVPFISLLFMASVMLPLFLPAGVSVDKLLRAQLAFIAFASAYLAEVVRGGLQAIPRGQHEAAAALGLGYWRTMALVVLPQALTHAIPPLVGTFITFFKDTSLVLVIGLFDLLRTTKTALTDAAWHGFHREAYLFIAFIYFLFCFFLSRYGRRLEAELARGRSA